MRRRIRTQILVGELEPRTLLAASAPTATWIGQDGHDLVGPSTTPGPNQVQDLHFALSGLPTDRSIVFIDITGYGSGQWMYNGPPGGAWAAALVRSPGASTADLYVEPYQVETGREFTIVLTYDDLSTSYIMVQGGTADPNLRVPGQELTAEWMGQDGKDWTGPGAAAGPEGFQDAHLSLSSLSANLEVVSATLTSPSGKTWQFGTNPSLFAGAELFHRPGDASRADLYFSPDSNLNGQTLTLSVVYANGKTDSAQTVAGVTDPGLDMPAPVPVTLTWDTISASWVGQDGQDVTGPGDVHLAVSGLPAGRTVVSAQLTDGTRISWNYARNGAVADPYALPLAFRTSASDPTRADVFFPPIRDESQAVLTLRLVLDDGTNLVTTVAGGSADTGLRAPEPAATSVFARPGDDLNALANQFGRVHLTAGTYNLSTPLVLNQPVTITADPGATLLFSQAAGSPTWTAAIKIHSGHTTLDGFAVRFAGPIRWTDGISYGPAVIGTTDSFDSGPNRLKVDIVLTHLDLESPPVSTPWETATNLIRVVTAENGVISGNILKGGTTEFIGGPWQVVGNTYRGTVPFTVTPTAFAGHYTHDVLIADNHVEPVGPSGKTWRFLVLTQSGINDMVRNNHVIGVGPRDDDTLPNPNASEVVLTEAYRLEFEGVPASISPDGLVVQIDSVLAGSVQAGDVLGILAGPEAGQWRLIRQAINATTFLLDRPIDSGATAISIATGFVNESFIGNTIDSRGSSTAFDLVLVGNHFGVQVVDNHLLGGARGFWISAYASETPGIYGWSHAPVLGATISGNTIEDTIQGGLLVVEHHSAIRSNVGRVYLTATLTDNHGIWTEAFLAQRAAAGSTEQPRVLTVGMATSNDPAELIVSVAGNTVQGPASVVSGATLWTVAAVVNGQVIRDQGTVLPTAPLPGPPPGEPVPGDGDPSPPPTDPYSPPDGSGTADPPDPGPSSPQESDQGEPQPGGDPGPGGVAEPSPSQDSGTEEILTGPVDAFNPPASDQSAPQPTKPIFRGPKWKRHPNPFRKRKPVFKLARKYEWRLVPQRRSFPKARD